MNKLVSEIVSISFNRHPLAPKALSVENDPSTLSQEISLEKNIRLENISGLRDVTWKPPIIFGQNDYREL